MRIDVDLVGGATLKAEGVDDIRLSYTRPVKYNAEALEELLPEGWWYSPLMAWPERHYPWRLPFAIRSSAPPHKLGWCQVGGETDE